MRFIQYYLDCLSHASYLIADETTRRAVVVDPQRDVSESLADAKELGIPISFELARFIKFIMTEIFPGGRLPSIPMVQERATQGGFTVTRVQELQPHYARTLDLWAAALEKRREEAIAIQSEEVYNRYMKYLTGCAKLFRQGQTNVCQFTLEK